MSEARFFVSNRAETLCQDLERSVGSCDPLDYPLVVVPNAFIKEHLSFYFAKESPVFAGIKILQYSELFSSLIENYESRRLGFSELYFRVLAWINAQIDSLGGDFEDLKGNSDRAVRQRNAYCEQLACDWMRWQDFSQKPIWQESWQEKLWDELFSKPREPFFEILEQVNFQSLEGKASSLHLFLPSFLPPLWIEFFRKCASVFSLNYYLLSPCSMFWGDLLSQKETHFLQSFWRKKGAKEEQIDALGDYLADTNRFLANFSRLGRQFFSSLEIENSIDKYHMNKALLQLKPYADLAHENLVFHESKRSFLSLIQADILLLRNTQERLSVYEDNISVQIHECSSKRRELEVLKENLKAVFLQEESQKHVLGLSDCLILCPNPKAYQAYIRMVFPSYEIHDLSSFEEIPLFKGFFSLLNLSKKRWRPSEIYELFESGCLAKKLKTQDLRLFQQFVERANISWGFSTDHRRKILQRELFIQKYGEFSRLSWKQGFSLLLESFAISSDLYFDYSQAQLLGEIFVFLEDLFTDLETLEQERTLGDFSKVLEAFLKKYFCEEVKGFETLRESLISLKKLEQDRFLDQSYDISSVLLFLEKLLEGKKTKEGIFSALRFAKIDSGAIWPAKIVYILGLQDGEFPRPESLSPFERFQKQRPFPSPKELDRYLFLEAFLSSREYFFISYVKEERQKGDSIEESLLVRDYLDYLDMSYEINDDKPSNVCVFVHAKERFDEKYFQGPKGNFMNFSKSDFSLAKAFYQGAQKSSQDLFEIKSSQSDSLLVKSAVDILSIQDLMMALIDPLQLYFREQLGAYFNHEKKLDLESEISPLLEFFLRKEALSEPFEKLWQRTQKQGLLPEGFCASLLKKKLKKELKNWKNNLEAMGVSEKEFTQLYLRLDYEQNPQEGVFPAISIGEKILYGKLFSVGPQGILMWGKKNRGNMIKSYVQSLIIEHLKSQFEGHFEKNLVFSLQKGEVFDFPKNEARERLSFLLDFSLLCKKQANPLKPEDYDMNFEIWQKNNIENETAFRHFFDQKLIKEESFEFWKDYYQEQFFSNFFERFS